MKKNPVETKVENAWARSMVYGALAHLWRYPDRSMLETILTPSRWTGWPEALRRTEFQSAECLDTVRQWLANNAEHLAGEAGGVLDEMQESYVGLFGHTVRGACPLYELEYGRSEIIQQASLLADVNGFYAAFGLMSAEEGSERPDHVSMECEFMGVLAAMEAHHAENSDEPQSLKTICDAQRSFLKDHLGCWMPSLARRTVEADPDGFYGAIAKLAGVFIASESQRLGVNCGSALLELRPIDPPEASEMTCGADASAPGSEKGSFVQVGIDSSIKSPG